MDLLAFILALQAEGKTAEEVKAAVDEYLEENPGAIDQAAVEAILDGRWDGIDEDVGGLKSAINTLEDTENDYTVEGSFAYLMYETLGLYVDENGDICQREDE